MTCLESTPLLLDPVSLALASSFLLPRSVFEAKGYFSIRIVNVQLESEDMSLTRAATTPEHTKATKNAGAGQELYSRITCKQQTRMTQAFIPQFRDVVFVHLANDQFCQPEDYCLVDQMASQRGVQASDLVFNRLPLCNARFTHFAAHG